LPQTRRLLLLCSIHCHKHVESFLLCLHVFLGSSQQREQMYVVGFGRFSVTLLLCFSQEKAYD
jgi:hypothetical protein